MNFDTMYQFHVKNAFTSLRDKYRDKWLFKYIFLTYQTKSMIRGKKIGELQEKKYIGFHMLIVIKSLDQFV